MNKSNRVFVAAIVGITAVSATSFVITGIFLNKDISTAVSTDKDDSSRGLNKPVNDDSAGQVDSSEESARKIDQISLSFPQPHAKTVVQLDIAQPEANTTNASSANLSNSSSENGKSVTKDRFKLSPATQKLFDLTKKLAHAPDSSTYQELQNYFTKTSTGENGQQFVLELLKTYQNSGISVSDRGMLHELLTSSGHRLVEQFAISRIERDGIQTAGPWLRLLADRSSGSSNAHSSLLDVLPDLVEPLALALGIAAIRPGVEPDSEESINSATAISGFAGHQDERVRAATINTLSAMRPNDDNYQYIVEEALSDPSKLVRTAALSSVLAFGIHSETIELKLFDIVRDSRAEKLIRQDAYDALRQFTYLNQQEKTELMAIEN